MAVLRPFFVERSCVTVISDSYYIKIVDIIFIM